jgi:hypothetical protein
MYNAIYRSFTTLSNGKYRKYVRVTPSGMGKSERERRDKKQIEYRDIDSLVLPLGGKR